MSEWMEGWKVAQAYKGRYFSFNPVAEHAIELAETGRCLRDVPDLLEYWIGQETRPAEGMPPLCLFAGCRDTEDFLHKFNWLWQPYGDDDERGDGVSLVVLPCQYLPVREETKGIFTAVLEGILSQHPATVFADCIVPTGEAIPARTFWEENNKNVHTSA